MHDVAGRALIRFLDRRADVDHLFALEQLCLRCPVLSGSNFRLASCGARQQARHFAITM
jgi:hypothetical protein